MSASVVAVAGSGGSLTTSVAANVAGLLARAGNRTLLVGTDPHGGLDHDLGLSALHPRSVVPGARPDLDVVLLDSGLAEALVSMRSAYDVVVVDGSGVAPGGLASAADCVLVPVRPDRTATSRVGAAVRRFVLPVLGVVLVGVPARPRAVHVRARRALQDELSGVAPVLMATVRSEVTVAWSARDRGLLAHELAATMDRTALDPAAIDAVLGLARDYAELAEEVVLRLHDGIPPA